MLISDRVPFPRKFPFLTSGLDAKDICLVLLSTF
jgi:hypothetical protein